MKLIANTWTPYTYISATCISSFGKTKCTEIFTLTDFEEPFKDGSVTRGPLKIVSYRVRMASKSSTLLNGPYDLRICRIFCAVAGPIPGTC